MPCTHFNPKCCFVSCLIKIEVFKAKFTSNQVVGKGGGADNSRMRLPHHCSVHGHISSNTKDPRGQNPAQKPHQPTPSSVHPLIHPSTLYNTHAHHTQQERRLRSLAGSSKAKATRRRVFRPAARDSTARRRTGTARQPMCGRGNACRLGNGKPRGTVSGGCNVVDQQAAG